MNYRILSALLSILLVITLSVIGLQFTGFVVFPGSVPDQANPSLPEEKESFSPAPIADPSPSPALHYEVIYPTRLEVHTETEKIERCPKESEITFMIQNTGHYPAEKIRVETSPTVSLSSCINCDFQDLAPESELQLTLTACSTKKQDAVFSFSAINADPVPITLE